MLPAGKVSRARLGEALAARVHEGCGTLPDARARRLRAPHAMGSDEHHAGAAPIRVVVHRAVPPRPQVRRSWTRSSASLRSSARPGMDSPTGPGKAWG
jgi:hypothetical protein